MVIGVTILRLAVTSAPPTGLVSSSSSAGTAAAAPVLAAGQAEVLDRLGLGLGAQP